MKNLRDWTTYEADLQPQARKLLDYWEQRERTGRGGYHDRERWAALFALGSAVELSPASLESQVTLPSGARHQCW